MAVADGGKSVCLLYGGPHRPKRDIAAPYLVGGRIVNHTVVITGHEIGRGGYDN